MACSSAEHWWCSLLAGIGYALATLIAFVVSATNGLFGWQEVGASLTVIDRHHGQLAPDGRGGMRSVCSTSRARGNVHGGRWWTLRGRRTPQPPPA